MGGTKRKAVATPAPASKKTKIQPNAPKGGLKNIAFEADLGSDSSLDKPGSVSDEEDQDHLDESSATSDEESEADIEEPPTESKKAKKLKKDLNGNGASQGQSAGKSSDAEDFNGDKTIVQNGNSSRESHAKQKQLALERKSSKPNADSIARSKKIWERLRRKSHVPKSERDELVNELFDIISGHVKDFVFKHDSVRVIQCALKYSSQQQRRLIAEELRGSYRELCESRYGKFLIAKMVVGDDQVRDMVVPEWYGHVKRLMKNSEASWIVDDVYRTIATKKQKARLLQEWYGPEFVLFAKGSGKEANPETADLAQILEKGPEKRGPIMRYLKETTNAMVQKKTTGYTMLHDAMLQYFINTKFGSPEHTEFLEMLRDDEGGDCLRNLAFTKSGSRLVCLALAYGSSKDRRTILKAFKTHIKLMAADTYAHAVLVASFDVVDDTVMLSKSITQELVGKEVAEKEMREEELLGMVENLNTRVPLLYCMSKEPPKWLLSEDDAAIIKEVKDIRKETSKKDSETRRLELVKPMSQPLLDLIASRTDVLVSSSFGCQFVTEVLFGAVGEKEGALKAIAGLAKSEMDTDLNSAHAGRMMKSLVQGGPFNKASKQIVLVEPKLGFHNVLFDVLGSKWENVVTAWAFGGNSFVVLAMLEADDFEHQDELAKALKKEAKRRRGEAEEVNMGTRLILEKIGSK